MNATAVPTDTGLNQRANGRQSKQTTPTPSAETDRPVPGAPHLRALNSCRELPRDSPTGTCARKASHPIVGPGRAGVPPRSNPAQPDSEIVRDELVSGCMNAFEHVARRRVPFPIRNVPPSRTDLPRTRTEAGLNLEDASGRCENAIRIEADRIDSLFHQKLGDLGEVGRRLAADARLYSVASAA